MDGLATSARMYIYFIKKYDSNDIVRVVTIVLRLRQLRAGHFIVYKNKYFERSMREKSEAVCRILIVVMHVCSCCISRGA